MSNILKTRKLNDAQSDLKYYSGCAGQIIRWNDPSPSSTIINLPGIVSLNNTTHDGVEYINDDDVIKRLTIYSPNEQIITATNSNREEYVTNNPIASTIKEIYNILYSCATKDKYLLDQSTHCIIKVNIISGSDVFILNYYDNKQGANYSNLPRIQSITLKYNGYHFIVTRQASEFGMMPNWTSYYNVEWRNIRTIIGGDGSDAIKSKLGSLGNISRMKQLAESGMPIVSRTSETTTSGNQIHDNYCSIYVSYFGDTKDNFLLRYVGFKRPVEYVPQFAPHIETIIVGYNSATKQWGCTQSLNDFTNGMMYLGTLTVTEADSKFKECAKFVDTCPLLFCNIIDTNDRDAPRGMYVIKRRFVMNTTPKTYCVEQIMHRDPYYGIFINSDNPEEQPYTKDMSGESGDKQNIWGTSHHFRHLYYSDEILTTPYGDNTNVSLGRNTYQLKTGWKELWEINQSLKHRLHEVIIGCDRFNLSGAKQYRILHEKFASIGELNNFLNNLSYNNANNYESLSGDSTDQTNIRVWNTSRGNSEYNNSSGYGKFIVKVGDNQTIYYLTLTKISDARTLMYMEGACFETISTNISSVNGTGIPNMIYRYGDKNADSSTTWETWKTK